MEELIRIISGKNYKVAFLIFFCFTLSRNKPLMRGCWKNEEALAKGQHGMNREKK